MAKRRKPARHAGERIDVRINPIVRERAVEEAQATEVTLNEVLNAALCQRYGLDPAAHPIPRKAPGRPLGGGRKKKRQS